MSKKAKGNPQAGKAPQGENVKPVPVQVVLNQIADLYTKGRIPQAHKLCLQVIKQRPRLAEAHAMMGVILLAMKKEDEARKGLQNAISLNPTAHYYSNLGELERNAGNLDEAEEAFRKANELDPKYPQAYNNYGILCFDRGDFEEAVKKYEQCIELLPDYPEVHNNLGNALRALKRNDEAMAEYERAVELREAYPEAYNNMGSALRADERYEEAEFCYRKALSLNRTYAEAINNLATLFMSRDNLDEALRVLDDGLKAGVKTVPILLTVARVQLRKGNHDQAQQACQMALQDEPESIEAFTVLGQISHDLDMYDDAIRNFEKAIELDPDNVEARNFYGIALKSIGRMDDARTQFEHTLEKNPKAFGAYSNIADLIKFDERPDLLENMENILVEAENPDSERYMGMHFAIGKALGDVGRYEEAFEHIQTGARMKRAQLDYNEEEVASFFASIKETFNADYFKNLPFEGLDTEKPVFVLGMPRSGSTLAEQIISSHPDVYGAGEIKTFSQSLNGLRGRFPALPRYPALVGKMSENHFRSVGQNYLDFVTEQSNGESRITDKLLTNYYFVGLLYTIFPKAKFIHTKRNPVDTCLSAYTKLFKDDMSHSYDLEELGRYYLMYEDLMKHWHKVLPKGVLIDAVYEDTVADTEKQAKRLISHCDLEWDDQCLAFYNSSRPVKTASVAQVRKPVYSSSVERWRKYEEQLQPLVKALKYKYKK